MKSVAIVGVGLLGGAVASRLLAAGFRVTGHDTSSEALALHEAQGLRVAPTVAAAAADADALFTVLPTPDVVETVWRGKGGLLETAPKRTVLLQMSTIDPAHSRRLAEAATASGHRFLDTPISGASRMVARGEGTIFVGGDAATAEDCRPLFEAIARKTVHVGPAGAASVAKLAANLIGGVSALALAEALVLGAKSGVEPAVLFDALRQTALISPGLAQRGQFMVDHDFPPLIRLDLFAKDFRLMLEQGLHAGAPLPLTSVAHQLCMATSAAGHGSEDLAAVVTTLEHLAGIRS